MDPNPMTLEEMEAMIYSPFDLDLLMDTLPFDIIDSSLPPNDNPAEDLGPQQLETECYMPLAGDWLSLEQLVLPEPGFHAAQTDFPLLPLYDAPAEGGFGPQQPQTEWYLPLGGATFTLQKQDVSATEFQAAQTGLPPLPPYYAPAEEMFGPQQPQTDSYMPVGAAPFSLQNPVMPAPEQAPPMYQPPTVMQPNHMYYQGSSFNHSQFNNVPVVSLPQGTDLTPIGYINGEICYGAANCSPPPVASDVVAINVPKKKRCYTKLHDESQPYVKMPPNAFMIFRMEQRPLVVAEIQSSECATVNKVIGKRWKSMSKEEQERYYEYARREKQIHLQLFPEWTTRENYGKKRKRIRRKGPNTTEDSLI